VSVLGGRRLGEERAREEVMRGRRARGHDVVVAPPWTLGRVCTVKREDDQMSRPANPRGIQGYAVAR
jgi:gamma-glutamyltranspeptidase/glutathione hydrolase